MLITTAELEEIVMRQPSVLVLLDVRWHLGMTEQENLSNYYDGHIPSSMRVDLDQDLARPASPEEGRHPLPDQAEWEATLRAWGINNDSDVVIYDEAGGAAAARAWWMLRWAGLRSVRILDGGWLRWTTERRRVAVGPGNMPWPGTFRFEGPQMPTVTIDEAADWPSHGILLDARSRERFTGEAINQVDRRFGHIPGARSMPSEDLISEDQGFRTPAEIAALLAERGVRTPEDARNVAAYCGSGVTAAHLIFSMELAGLPGARLFPGSWSQWAEDTHRPVETGEWRRD